MMGWQGTLTVTQPPKERLRLPWPFLRRDVGFFLQTGMMGRQFSSGETFFEEKSSLVTVSRYNCHYPHRSGEVR
jgi:hypothetical protein